MRIFRQGAGYSDPEKTGFGIERRMVEKRDLHRVFGYVLEDFMARRLHSLKSSSKDQIPY